MDWTLRKTTSSSWDIPEFEQENSLGGEQIKVDFSVDLKLGHVVNAGDSKSRDNLAAPGVPKKALMPPVGPSKRARAVDGGVNVAYCVVDGCNADLSGCREYHRRHKVCEMHSKAPEVTIGGLKQRFCQQCSRYSLTFPPCPAQKAC
ncbi:unnamed protein product [Thlaspi arvense]|uniref:SBP-type domain-containing protein n=1 Tax=Thlaspi arvense TaxID=13288 RepID=A0AAU9S0F7_THLAR|nr:unnamed protein product [Thlaspi arvense]